MDNREQDEFVRFATGLSKAQRGWLEDAFYGRGGWRIVGKREKACALGLCEPGTSLITPLGLAVRAYFQSLPTKQGVL